MFDNKNHYELRIEKNEDGKKYFAGFIDVNKKSVEKEISRDVAKTMFVDFVRIERNLKRFDERRLEHSVQTEQSLERKMLHKPLTVEEEVFRKMNYAKLHKAIEKLPLKQKRRVVLHFFDGLPVKEIAKKEGCTPHSVYVGIERAKNNLKKFLK